MSLYNVRRDFSGFSLDETSVARDPVEQFRAWFDQMAASKTEEEPTAMTLATCDPATSRASARVVLLKKFDEAGFVFFTNYGSRKGRELAANPHASLLFYWQRFHRQVRIDGVVDKTSREESVEYFRSRPRESQLGAWASEQSETIPDRAFLEARLEEVKKRFDGQTAMDPPEDWGGYRLLPHTFEFWQGRLSRLHDRLVYRRRDDGSWDILRLSP